MIFIYAFMAVGLTLLLLDRLVDISWYYQLAVCTAVAAAINWGHTPLAIPAEVYAGIVMSTFQQCMYAFVSAPKVVVRGRGR